jgi:hypothetical protein
VQFCLRRIRSYLCIYAGIVGFSLLTYCACTITFVFVGIRASRVVHSRLLDSIMASTFRFVVVSSWGPDTDRYQLAGCDAVV